MSKTGSLREFQQQLTQRLSEASGAASASTRLGVQAGSRQWLLKLDDAGEVLSVPEMTSVPLTHSWFIGLANIRGNLAGVVDFSAFMGEAPAPRTPESRLVLIAERFGAYSSLLVSRVAGLRNLEQFQQGAGGSERPWVGAQYRDPDGGIWHELNIDALVAHDDFLRVGV